MIKKEISGKVKEDLKQYFADRDYMVIAVPKEEPARVYALKASNTVETARKIHNLDDEETEALGSVMVSALLLTSLVKHASNQKVLVKVSGLLDGKRIIAEADGKGRVRVLIESSGNEDPSLTVIKELGMGTPYTSIVPLQGKDMSSNLSFYLTQSEQIPSGLRVEVSVDENGKIYGGGFLLQTLGGISKMVLDILDERTVTVPRITELLKEGKRPEDIATMLLKDMNPSLIGLKEIEYYCPCSEEIARASLLSLGEEELKELTMEGPAEVTCRFCGRVYRFSISDIINKGK